MKTRLSLGVIGCGFCLCFGCQGGLGNLPNLSNIGSPARVPPPPVGSFQAPSNYSDSNRGGSTATGPATPTLGQLRKLESGDETPNRFSADNVTEWSINDGSTSIKPQLAEAIASPRASYPLNSEVQQASATIPAEDIRWRKP